jgi:hypothetical protein
VLVVGLRLGQRSRRCFDLRRGVDGGIRDLANRLALAFDGLAELELLAGGGGFGGRARGQQILALD